MTDRAPPPTYQMPFQPQQQMHIQKKNWNNNGGGGQVNGRGKYKEKKRNNRNGGNVGNGGKSWSPGNVNNNSRGGHKQLPWIRHLTTGQSINPNNIKAFKNENYCWTHCGNISNKHTSRTCSQQHPSGMHNINATRNNMMGVNPKGNHIIKPRGVGKPEAPPGQRPQLTNNIWNPQAQ